jgi:mRNA interferase RelE/StbE
MPYAVVLKRTAEKELAALPRRIHDKVVDQLLSLKTHQRPVAAKRLQGREGYRIRVGDYRILYVIDDAERRVEIVSVAHRKEVYR